MRMTALVAGLAGSLMIAAMPAQAEQGPFNQAQLDKGKSEYNTHCRTCHAANGKGALGPALMGDTFKTRFGGQNFSDIRTWIHENMPQTAPKSLSDAQLDPIMAYIMSLNGFEPGDKELTADAAKSVTLAK